MHTPLQDNDGFTPLHLAVYFDQEDFVKQLLRPGQGWVPEALVKVWGWSKHNVREKS